MSFIFIPQEIELHKLATDVSYESQNIVIKTEMDFGSHSRNIGTPTVEMLSVTCDMNTTQLKLFMNWVRVIGADIFYSTFPDADYAEIEKGKFYAFNFESTAIQKNKRGRIAYTVDFTLNWHLSIQGIDRV